MASSHETVFENFTECPIAPLEDIPTYNYLTELNAYLNACLVSMHSDLGYRTLGYLVLKTNLTVLALQCATPFIDPVHQGGTPHIPDQPPTGAVISVITCEHTDQLRVFERY